MRSFEWFVARRYLFSRRRRVLVSVITLISILGVAIGVAALIVVIGVMDGADRVLMGRIAELYPHVRLIPPDGTSTPLDPDLLARIEADRRVARVQPIINKKTFIQAPGRGRPELVQLIGVDTLGKGSLYQLSDRLKDRTVRIHEGQIVLGALLGYQVGVNPGSELNATATNPISTAVGPLFKTLPLSVAYWVNTGFADFDETTAFVSVAQIRKLYRLGPGADYIHVKLKDPWHASAFKASLGLPAGWTATTWSEENREFFGALKLEKLGTFLVLLLVIFVAALSIVGTLILMVSEKTREIGILRALGASEAKVARIFLLNGVLIGLVGTAAGVAIGVGLCLLIPLARIEMPRAVYNIQSLPVQVKWLSVCIIVACSLLICTLMALFPARQAAQLHPVEALRHD